MRRVNGKVALVTGAGSGIGRSVAVTLAAEGAKVIVTDLSESGLGETQKIICEACSTALALKQDVISEERWIEIIALIEEKFGGLHILVNNAGISVPGSIFTMTLEDWQRQITVNLDSVFLGMKHSIPLITKSGGGSVINMSSGAGLVAAPGNAGYGASKSAVRYLTKSAALECANVKNNVRVNSVHPGMIETPMWDALLALGMGNRKPGTNKFDLDTPAAQKVPLGYPGQASDIAAGVLFLASDEARYMTGAEMVIDGGVTL